MVLWLCQDLRPRGGPDTLGWLIHDSVLMADEFSVRAIPAVYDFWLATHYDERFGH